MNVCLGSRASYTRCSAAATSKRAQQLQAARSFTCSSQMYLTSWDAPRQSNLALQQTVQSTACAGGWCATCAQQGCRAGERPGIFRSPRNQYLKVFSYPTGYNCIPVVCKTAVGRGDFLVTASSRQQVANSRDCGLARCLEVVSISQLRIVHQTGKTAACSILA